MVGYCPLDELEDPAPPQPAPRPRVAPPPRRAAPARRRIVRPEETECNYVVMFFIVGVIVLALSDNIK
jgi:hypothetical protein